VPLARLANRPHGRYRIENVRLFIGATMWRPRQNSGAVRYDISYQPKRGRWYLDASWKTPGRPVTSLDELRQGAMLAVDLNVGHLAAIVLDTSGNRVGKAHTIPPELSGCSASTRDGRLRGVISDLRRERRDSTRPEDREGRAANSAVRPIPALAGLPQARDREPADRNARGQPQPRQRTRPAERASPGNQVVQDRSGPPVTVSRLMPMNADEPGTVGSEPVPNDPTRKKGSDEARTSPRT
jgi:hypothetical protein